MIASLLADAPEVRLMSCLPCGIMLVPRNRRGCALHVLSCLWSYSLRQLHLAQTPCRQCGYPWGSSPSGVTLDLQRVVQSQQWPMTNAIASLQGSDEQLGAEATEEGIDADGASPGLLLGTQQFYSCCTRADIAASLPCSPHSTKDHLCSHSCSEPRYPMPDADAL